MTTDQRAFDALQLYQAWARKEDRDPWSARITDDPAHFVFGLLYVVKVLLLLHPDDLPNLESLLMDRLFTDHDGPGP